MKFRKNPVVIEAITFDELVAHGIASGANIVNGMPWSFTYAGHPITHENDQCYIVPTLESAHGLNMTPDNMLITGVKGEIYPCQLDIFAATYEAVVENAQLPATPTTCLTFGDALRRLKLGEKVARAGWNGKGMFVYFVPAAAYPAQTGVAKSFFGDDALVPYNAYLALKGVDGTINTWAPSISDTLAEDWVVVT